MFSKTVINEITKVAEANGYEAAALLAIVDVESAGTAFWNVNGEAKPAIRFEGHYFYGRLQGDELLAAISQGVADKKVGGVINPSSFADRYALLTKAATINQKAAYESTSWGLGQVMGTNWKSFGYKDVFELTNKAATVSGQVEIMIKFIEVNDLKPYIDNYQWAKFAAAYNGPAYKKNAYHTKMAKKYEDYVFGSDNAAQEEVIQLQNMLNKVNPDRKVEVDGVLGAGTKAALKDFQLKNGLKADGIYGPLSRAALQKAYLLLENNATKNAGIGGTSIIAVGTGITEIAKQIEPLAKVSQIAQYVFLGLLVIGGFFIIKPYIWPKKVI